MPETMPKYSKLEEKTISILEDISAEQIDDISIHKEERSDQEGNITITEQRIVTNKPDLIQAFVEMYRKAGKRDKVYIMPHPKGWVIKHQTRNYIYR